MAASKMAAPARAVGSSGQRRELRFADRRLSRRVLAVTVWLILLVNAAVIVRLWYAGGGVSSVHGWGDFFTTVGRITGLLGAYFLLIQVLLLARIPIVERLMGFDRGTVWHRRNGKLALYLVLAHVVFITLGYASMDRISLQAEASALISNYPGMIAATVGTGLMVVVVLTSLVIVRRRLRYETWYLVHLTAYSSIVLTWFHEIPTGNELAANSTAAAYWTALYLVTLALLVLFRLFQPAIAAFRHRMRVSEVISEGPNVISLRITGRRLDRLGARPGQFFLWRFLSQRGRWWEAHPFSLSAAPDGESLRITVKNSGDFTSRIADVVPGTAVVAEGPFGAFTDGVRRGDRTVLIAGGIGITPVRALIEDMDGDLTVIYRAVSEEDLIFRRELSALASNRGVKIFYVIGDHRAPGAGRLLSPEHLRQMVPEIDHCDVYVCGPPAMMRFIAKNVRDAGVPATHIHTEQFALA